MATFLRNTKRLLLEALGRREKRLTHCPYPRFSLMRMMINRVDLFGLLSLGKQETKGIWIPLDDIATPALQVDGMVAWMRCRFLLLVFMPAFPHGFVYLYHAVRDAVSFILLSASS